MISFSNIRGTIISKIKRYGYTGLISRICAALSSYLGINYQISFFYKKSLSKDEVESKYQFEELSYQDFVEQSRYNSLWFNEEKMDSLKKAFQIDGTKAIGLYDENKLLISYGFLSTTYLGLKNIKLLDDDCYFWDDYTHPSARGKRLHMQLNISREREAYRIGKKRALVIVASFNKASCKTYERLGYCIMQKYYTVRFWKNGEKTNFKYGKQQ